MKYFFERNNETNEREDTVELRPAESSNNDASFNNNLKRNNDNFGRGRFRNFYSLLKRLRLNDISAATFIAFWYTILLVTILGAVLLLGMHFNERNRSIANYNLTNLSDQMNSIKSDVFELKNIIMDVQGEIEELKTNLSSFGDIDTKINNLNVQQLILNEKLNLTAVEFDLKLLDQKNQMINRTNSTVSRLTGIINLLKIRLDEHDLDINKMESETLKSNNELSTLLNETVNILYESILDINKTHSSHSSNFSGELVSIYSKFSDIDKSFEIKSIKPGDVKYSLQQTDHDGWLLCNGRELAKESYPHLFQALGYTFGQGILGDRFFKIPDARGRVPVGAGQPFGLTKRTLGERGGVEKVTISSNNLPNHMHNVYQSYETVAPSSTWRSSIRISTLASTDSTEPKYYPNSFRSIEPIENMQPYIALNAFIYSGLN